MDVLKRSGARPWHKRINTNQLYKRVITQITTFYNRKDMITMDKKRPTSHILGTDYTHFFHEDAPLRKWLEADMIYTVASEMWAEVVFDNGQTRREWFNSTFGPIWWSNK